MSPALGCVPALSIGRGGTTPPVRRGRRRVALTLADRCQLGFRHGIEQARKLLSEKLAEKHETANPDAVVCVVGDTPSDILAARANNAPVVAVATGIYSYRMLRANCQCPACKAASKA